MTQDVLFDIHGNIGFITLNRPEALNALNLDMIRAMDQKLVEWAKDPAICAVVVTGAGDRAFCSGGDVKAVALEAKEKKGTLARDFFREEYTLNNRIFTFPKPYISLINGIVMGGGKGISAHGSHRIVTENTLFAMPETSIGFFPDVGGGYFLPRCPGQTGLYLALTSKRIKAIDTIYIGFATHYVPSQNLEDLVDTLVKHKWHDLQKDHAEVTEVIEDFTTEPPGQSEIAPWRDRIDRHFSFNHVEEIFMSLQKDNISWAQETLSALYGMSPTSLKIALKQIRRGETLSFGRVMEMEYRLSQACVVQPDFYEGIRAALIDKDRKPKWNPARVSDVSDAAVEGFFASLGKGDLIL